jgi:hypothetical protein
MAQIRASRRHRSLTLLLGTCLTTACALPIAESLEARAQPPAPAGNSNPFAEPLRLIADARASYRTTRDYSCLFVKQERIRGQLQPENLITLQVRTQPFSVAMRWLKPHDLAGQEVCFVTGQNNGMMRVHAVGIRGVAGFVSVDPTDPRALEHSRHSVQEAGIGNLIERFGQRWEAESRWGRTEVRVAEFTYDRRRCTRVETIHRDNFGGQIPFYRSAIYFDKQNHLPIRVENYDWPRQGEDPRGVLAESYSYANLRVNLGVNEMAFNK